MNSPRSRGTLRSVLGLLPLSAFLVGCAGHDTPTALDGVLHGAMIGPDPTALAVLSAAGSELCGDAFTPIFAIQGSGPSTPLLDQVVTTEGVVVGDYEGASPALRGFYLQDPVGDGDPATSDGLFVFNGSSDLVSLGDRVRVTGTADEVQGQTQIGAVTLINVCGVGLAVTPVDIALPFSAPGDLERYEGMLVRLPQTLHVTEIFSLGRFGEIVMSSGGRLMQPTGQASPGTAAAAIQAANDLNRIIIDDALNVQNREPIVFGRGGSPLSATNTLRGGDTATGISGVLTYTWSGNGASGNAFRLRPEGALGGQALFMGNPRPAAPGAVGGAMRIASFNLLNYFNTFSGCAGGLGGASTACRGAENASEFERQWQKTVAALTTMDAAVLGVVELENDGYGPTSAIADLVDRLNTATAPGRYAFIDVDAATGQTNALGLDGIRAGLVYQPAVVVPVGTTAVLNSVEFVNAGEERPQNQPSLAQAFEGADRTRFVVNVNHFKSRGSGCSTPDSGDGQGNCSIVRANAASRLGSWLATDPTGIADPDVLILGDLNSYARETPITLLQAGGFTDLIGTRLGANAYTYVLGGQWGYLNHALASTSLDSQVSGVTVWHSNADEPSVLDYNTNFKSADQLISLYAPDPFRASDHDPVIVGLNLRAPAAEYVFGGFLNPVSAFPTFTKVRAGRGLPVKFSLGGYRGMEILDAGYPKSRLINCDGSGDSVASSAGAPGRSGLKYDPTTDTYSYVWATRANWRGTCRELVVRFADESVHRARFDFRP